MTIISEEERVLASIETDNNTEAKSITDTDYQEQFAERLARLSRTVLGVRSLAKLTENKMKLIPLNDEQKNNSRSFYSGTKISLIVAIKAQHRYLTLWLLTS